MSALSDLQAVMFQWKDQVSVIKPTLHQRTGCYRLQLVEDFGTVDDAGNSMPSRGLDECVKWVEETLQPVNRLTHSRLFLSSKVSAFRVFRFKIQWTVTRILL